MFAFCDDFVLVRPLDYVYWKPIKVFINRLMWFYRLEKYLLKNVSNHCKYSLVILRLGLERKIFFILRARVRDKEDKEVISKISKRRFQESSNFIKKNRCF